MDKDGPVQSRLFSWVLQGSSAIVLSDDEEVKTAVDLDLVWRATC